jgi:hypothetical protein
MHKHQWLQDLLKTLAQICQSHQVQALLAAWKSARQNKATAYLTSTLSYETVGYSPKDMMYSDSISNF